MVKLGFGRRSRPLTPALGPEPGGPVVVLPPAAVRSQACRARGQALPLIALMMIALIGFTGLTVDVSLLILRTLQQQRAADAAALAGVVKLPDDTSAALVRAREYAAKNGYPNQPGGDPYPVVTASKVLPYNTRLRVVISAQHEVYFMRIFGINTVPVSRASEALYALPVRLGSPDPYFGVGNLTPIAAANLPPDPTNGGGCPNCALNPSPQLFWASIDGPSTQHALGDAYNTRWAAPTPTIVGGGWNGSCLAGGAIVPGTPNPDYIAAPDPASGYSYNIALDSRGMGPIDVYVYDPAQYYRIGQGPYATFTPTDSDTGDVNPCWRYNGTNVYTFSTTFTLYPPDNTPDYFNDDVAATSRFFRDPGVSPTPATFDPHNKWFRVGTVNYDPTHIGLWRLQVTTNQPGGVGNNQYSLALGGPRRPTALEQIYGINNMSISNNIRFVAGGQQIEWYLAKIPGEHAGERMSVRMFDPGDSACYTAVSLYWQGDPNPVDFLVNWTGSPQTLLPTTDAGGHSLFNGQWVTLGVTLPPSGVYVDSWWTVRYIVGSGCQGSTTDRTVWEILMLGSPIHNIPPDQ